MKKKLTVKERFEIKLEREVIKLICQEYTTKEIAEKIGVSRKTLDLIRSNLLKKTKSKNVVGLLKYAIEHNIYKLK